MKGLACPTKYYLAILPSIIICDAAYLPLSKKECLRNFIILTFKNINRNLQGNSMCYAVAIHLFMNSDCLRVGGNEIHVHNGVYLNC